jgi:hypothetical protein
MNRQPGKPPRSGDRAAVERALEERNRLYRHYVAAKRSRRQDLYATHPQGWQLKLFAEQLGRFTAADAAAMLSYVQGQARDWLATAPPEMRHEALALVDERIQRIRERAGLHPIDDPLPGEADDVFQLCRRELT